MFTNKSILLGRQPDLLLRLQLAVVAPTNRTGARQGQRRIIYPVSPMLERIRSLVEM